MEFLLQEAVSLLISIAPVPPMSLIFKIMTPIPSFLIGQLTITRPRLNTMEIMQRGSHKFCSRNTSHSFVRKGWSLITLSDVQECQILQRVQERVTVTVLLCGSNIPVLKPQPIQPITQPHYRRSLVA